MSRTQYNNKEMVKSRQRVWLLFFKNVLMISLIIKQRDLLTILWWLSVNKNGMARSVTCHKMHICSHSSLLDFHNFKYVVYLLVQCSALCDSVSKSLCFDDYYHYYYHSLYFTGQLKSATMTECDERERMICSKGSQVRFNTKWCTST